MTGVQTCALPISKVVPAGSCREALAVAARAMKQDAALIVCGSFYLAGEIRDMLKGKFGKGNL